MKIENNQNISEIIMYPTAITKCAIGQDWYQNEFEIHFEPNRCYPDYMEVQAYIMKEVDGQELNIEEAVEKIYDYLTSEYDPYCLKVIDRVHGNKVHFDVCVIKEN